MKHYIPVITQFIKLTLRKNSKASITDAISIALMLFRLKPVLQTCSNPLFECFPEILSE